MRPSNPADAPISAATPAPAGGGSHPRCSAQPVRPARLRQSAWRIYRQIPFFLLPESIDHINAGWSFEIEMRGRYVTVGTNVGECKVIHYVAPVHDQPPNQIANRLYFQFN